MCSKIPFVIIRTWQVAVTMMKPYAAFFFALVLSKGLQAQQKFTPLWKDNFDSAQIDYARWSNAYSWGRTILNNHELQYYTAGKNLIPVNGILKILAKKEPVTACIDSSLPTNKELPDSLPNLRTLGYTSGLLRTKQKFLYGKFEIRCKLPSGKGTWPAFWLYGGPCGEIDIFEKPWKFHYSITNNFHFDSAGQDYNDFRFTRLQKRNTFSKEFHTYALAWTPDSLQWFIDGTLVRTEHHRFNNCPMELIANLALADSDFWGHTPYQKNWNKSFYIDYIKVWKLSTQP